MPDLSYEFFPAMDEGCGPGCGLVLMREGGRVTLVIRHHGISLPPLRLAPNVAHKAADIMHRYAGAADKEANEMVDAAIASATKKTP